MALNAMNIGDMIELGPFFGNLSSEQISGIVVSNTSDHAVVELTYFGVFIGKAKAFTSGPKEGSWELL